MRPLWSWAVAASVAFSAVAHAGLIAHYDFSDGDLLDNEVGSEYTLTEQRKNGGAVSTNAVDGTVVFTGGRSDGGVNDPIAWLETVGPGVADDFTVSFWFRTDTVDQEHAYLGLFSSSSSGVAAGNWQIHSDGAATPAVPEDGSLCARFDGNTVAFDSGAPLHAADTWYHVAVRKDNDATEPISFHLTSITNGAIGAPVFQSSSNNVTLGELVLGVNRGANQSYGMEVANVRIFDDSDIPLDMLYDEGITATLKLPAVSSFTADDYYVDPGADVTLSWETTNATAVSLSPGLGAVDAVGSTSVTVTATTTFSLIVSNELGAADEGLTIYAGPPRPNFIIFLVDDMGPMDTSVPFVYDTGGNPVSYNFNDLYVTPNMEKLAANGMRFSNAYAQPTCSPTRASLMTGLNTTGHAVTSWINTTGSSQGQYAPANYRRRGFESADEETLPKWLGAAGYRTIHTGKGHFTDQHNASVYDAVEDPRFIGFDVNIGGSWQGQPGSYLGTANYASGSRPSWLIPGVEEHHGTGTFLTEALTIEANEAISETIARGQPFFLYMSHYAVHSPFMRDPRATGDYSAVSGNDLDFATMLEGMDLSLGEIVAHLEAEGVAEDTFIMFMGDNGSDNRLLRDNALPDAPYNDYPLRGMKGNRSEGGSRIPMIAAWAKPDATNSFQQALPIPTNSVEHDIVACWDLPITLMSVAGVSIPTNAHTHGYDLSPYLRGTPGSHREQELIIYYPHGRDNNDHFANYREGAWKLTYLWEEERFLLFDLGSDPTESTNLFSANPEKVLHMARGMARQFDEEWGSTYGAIWPTYPVAGEGALSTTNIMGTHDLDGDGRIDADEDLNGNGLVDPGETSPDDADTDADGSDDHSEVRLGLDPLDPGQFFRLRVQDGGAGAVELAWPSRPGLTFDVRSNTNLEESVSLWSVDSGIPAASGSNETTRGYPTTSQQAFFAVELR